ALLLAAYPFSYFYSAPYSESLFLLSVVGAVFHFLRRDWIAAACWGTLAGLTRPNGCFLSLPLALLAWQYARHSARSAEDTGIARAAVGLGVAAAPVAGMLVFTVYLHRLTGVWFAWARSHAAWGRTLQGPSSWVDIVPSAGDQSLLQM